MISAVDTNIMLDVITRDHVHGRSSLALLEKWLKKGAFVISEVVYAELAPQFSTRQELDSVLMEANARLVLSNADVAYLAGRKWAEYRAAGGTRSRLLADFLVGAHAQVHADHLLTRDRGFFHTYFPELTVIEP